VALVGAAAVLGGCAAAAKDAAPPPGSAVEASGDQPPRGFPDPSGKCLFLSTIEDWQAVDPYHLLVRTRATGWQWEITLDRRCSEILFATALEWNTPDTRVCDYRTDAITVPGNRCTIGAIRPHEDNSKRRPRPAGGW